MPYRCPTDARLPDLMRAQDWVISRDQALAAGLTRGAIDRKLRDAHWTALLPGVYGCGPGEPSRRQMLIGAQLYAGEGSAIDSDDACIFHGLRAVRCDDAVVRVAVPQRSTARSRGFVVVRRTSAPLTMVRTDRLRYVDVATAAIAAARRRCDERRVVAILSDALQRRLVSYDDLVRAHIRAAPQNARLTDGALEHLRAGARSAPEAQFRVLAEASLVLPSLLYNCVLRLPSGRVVSPDALALDAGLVHETNGASAHRRDDLFESMQERHDAMTEAGLTVLHNSPRRIFRCGREVIAQVERCYVRNAGRGLPAGIELMRIAA